MSEQDSLKSGDGKQVSKARKVISGIILLALLVVLGIEGRAGFGHSSSAKALQDIAPDGAFQQDTVTREQVEAMMVLSPNTEELDFDSGRGRVEYKYEWKSLIRPLMANMPATELYVSYSEEEPQYAMYYGTDAPEKFQAPSIGPGWDADGGGGAAAPPALMAPSPEESEEDGGSSTDEAAETGDAAGDSATTDDAKADDGTADDSEADGGSTDDSARADSSDDA